MPIDREKQSAVMKAVWEKRRAEGRATRRHTKVYTAEERARMSAAARNRAKKLHATGKKTSIEGLPPQPCSDCDELFQPGRLVRHQRNCFADLVSFVSKQETQIQLDLETGCLVWTGKTNDQKPKLGNSRRISRVVLELSLGRQLQKSEHALHTCDNTMCVNWWHLWAGSHAENMADMKSKGRAARHGAHMRWHVYANYVGPKNKGCQWCESS